MKLLLDVAELCGAPFENMNHRWLGIHMIGSISARYFFAYPRRSGN